MGRTVLSRYTNFPCNTFPRDTAMKNKGDVMRADTMYMRDQTLIDGDRDAITFIPYLSYLIVGQRRKPPMTVFNGLNPKS